MKLKRTRDGQLRLHLTRREWVWMQIVLEGYPSIPNDYHRISRSPLQAGDDVLLDAENLRRESRKEHRDTLKDLVRRWLGVLRSGQGQSVPALVFNEAAIEHLLQVLNDVRVGAWIQLGCPEDTDWESDPDPDHLPLLSRMDLAGLLESLLLEALHGPDLNPPAPPA